MAPASNEYVIGRPFVSRATLKLANGKRFTVVAEDLSDAHPYVSSVTLNGRPLAKSTITHGDILSGGELRFVMQSAPNTRWATSPKDRPFSMSGYR